MSGRSSVLIHASYVVECRLRARDSVFLLLATWEKKTDSAGYIRYEIQLITYKLMIQTFHVTLMLARAIGN